MLLLAQNLRELSFGKLMEVYRESNGCSGEEFFPMETPERQLALAEERFYQYLQEDFFSKPDARYYIWSEDGEYVSALRLWTFLDGQLLEGLETKSGQRRKGYAASLIRAVQRHFPAGTRIYSHVSRNNRASLRLHEGCGFQVLQESARYLDGTVSTRALTLCWEKEIAGTSESIVCG